jgi:hypothetical protein
MTDEQFKQLMAESRKLQWYLVAILIALMFIAGLLYWPR